ncbi:MAG: fibrobacter succinogenes major paralogous domain-containing protein [Prevotellaceae bacterium]|jgi:uncharacterized protein (TIGR02145 family)|nr:fibrobacter succinogenes major paralogous domain-containing protein [Prevotellaceae bacterium]
MKITTLTTLALLPVAAAFGTVIDGLEWANTNVAQPGTFAEKPDMYTEFYQWNRLKAWPATGSISGNWNNSPDQSPTWTVNPCPTGWRLPTNDEYMALDGKGSTWVAANAKGNAVAGRFYGKRHANCSLPNDMTDCVFFPATGYRNITNGESGYQGAYGDYWSNTQASDLNGYHLFFYNLGSNPATNNSKASGFSIRCVR